MTRLGLGQWAMVWCVPPPLRGVDGALTDFCPSSFISGRALRSSGRRAKKVENVQRLDLDLRLNERLLGELLERLFAAGRSMKAGLV